MGCLLDSSRVRVGLVAGSLYDSNGFLWVSCRFFFDSYWRHMGLLWVCFMGFLVDSYRIVVECLRVSYVALARFVSHSWLMLAGFW